MTLSLIVSDGTIYVYTIETRGAGKPSSTTVLRVGSAKETDWTVAPPNGTFKWEVFGDHGCKGLGHSVAVVAVPVVQP